MSNHRLLVTGAAGHLGSFVVSYLLDTLHVDPSRIIATTRAPEKLQVFASRGVEVRAADFDRPESLADAFAGAARLLLISTDALDRPGRRLEQHLRAIDAAARANVPHVVYTSMPKPETSSLSLATDHLGTERALAASGMTFSILRNNWYFENLFYSLPAAIASGTWYTSAGDGRIGYVSRNDCARVAAVELAAGGSDKSRFDVSGSVGLTTSEVAGAISEALSTEIRVVHVSDAELTRGLLAAGVPPPIASLFTEFDVNTREGGLDLIADTVRRVTGRRPETLRDFIEQNLDALRATTVTA